MKLKELSLTVSRTVNFEKVEVGATVEVDENEKSSTIMEKLSKVVNAAVDKELEKLMASQEARKAEEERIRLLNKLPETKEEAYAVTVDDGRTLEDLTGKELNSLLTTYDNNTKIGRGVRLILGVKQIKTTVTATSENVVSPSSDAEFAELEKEKLPKFFKNGNHGFRDATQAEVDRLSNLNNKELALRLLGKLKRYQVLAAERGIALNFTL